MMKFDELCEFVLVNEADYDSLTGKGKIFSLSDYAEETVQSIDLNAVKELIRKTTLPFTTKYLVNLVVEDLMDYLPAETPDLKDMLKRNIWSAFDESEKKSARAANVLFAFLKKKKLITPGIPKKNNKEDIESLAKDLDKDIADDITGEPSMHDVKRYGGSIPRSTGHPEDESMYY